MVDMDMVDIDIVDMDMVDMDMVDMDMVSQRIVTQRNLSQLPLLDTVDNWTWTQWSQETVNFDGPLLGPTCTWSSFLYLEIFGWEQLKKAPCIS